MIEDILIQYGALGICMIMFMGFFYKYYSDSKTYQDKLINVVDNNTIALTKVYEVIAHCPKIRTIK